MATKDATGVTIFETDGAGLIVFGLFEGANAPTTTNKFAPGCILVGGGKVYSNGGDSVTPVFQNINDISTAEIATAAVTLAKLASGITPSHVVKFAGKATTVGGAASEDVTVTGAVAGDIVIASLIQKGGTPRTLLTAITGTDKITLTFSGDPSTDHIVGYQVLRAAA